MFSLFASCKAELQSSRYGFGEPYPGVFWRYYDECASYFYKNGKVCESCKLDVWFSKELDRAETYRRRVELVSELIKLNGRHFTEKIDILAFSQKKYGPEEGKNLYEDGKKLYQECWE